MVVATSGRIYLWYLVLVQGGIRLGLASATVQSYSEWKIFKLGE